MAALQKISFSLKIFQPWIRQRMERFRATIFTRRVRAQTESAKDCSKAISFGTGLPIQSRQTLFQEYSSVFCIRNVKYIF